MDGSVAYEESKFLTPLAFLPTCGSPTFVFSMFRQQLFAFQRLPLRPSASFTFRNVNTSPFLKAFLEENSKAMGKVYNRIENKVR